MTRLRTLQTPRVPSVRGHASGDLHEEAGAGQGAGGIPRFREEAGPVLRSAFHCGSTSASPLAWEREVRGGDVGSSGVAATMESHVEGCVKRRARRRSEQCTSRWSRSKS